MDEETKSFVSNFFRDMGSEIKEKKDFIEISKVPISFQKFYGKSCPYYFCFDSQKNLKNEEIELIEKGNYLLKCIRSYLDNSAKNTLLKINLEDNLNKQEYLSSLNFPNSIASIKNFRKTYSFFMRFIFHTSFQYLNKKEKIIEEIFVHNKEIVKGDLNEYTLEEGNSREVSIPNIKDDYLLAKEELNKRINPKIENISNYLENYLEKEINRIDKHTQKEKAELEKNITKNIEKIEQLKKQNENTERHEKILKNLRKELNETDFEKEKKHQIKIEESRTGLNINSKLFNTTIIYYPVFIKKIELKNEITQNSFFLEYDPLIHKVSEIKCSVCNKPTKKILLCSNGHITCESCSSKCSSCNKLFCSECLNKKCELCRKLICGSCSTRCSKCGKLICKSHTKIDPLTKKVFCSNCLKRCERCFEFKSPDRFLKSKKTGVEICESCYNKEVKEITKKTIFKE